MKKIIVLALLLSGCAGTAYDTDDESRIHRAAVSWVGAPVDDMVSAWGEPNNLNVEPTEYSDGVMRWRSTRRPDASSRIGGSSLHTCIVEAYYGPDGTVKRVETMTTSCDDLYTEDQLIELTR